MKRFSLVITALSMFLLANWSDAQVKIAPRAKPVHPVVLSAVKRIRLPANHRLAPTTQLAPTLTRGQALLARPAGAHGVYRNQYSCTVHCKRSQFARLAQ